MDEDEIAKLKLSQDEIKDTLLLVTEYLEERHTRKYPSALGLFDEEEQIRIHRYCDEVTAKAMEFEPMVTSDLQDIEEEIGKLRGLEHRIKTRESIINKAIADSISLKMDFEKACKGLNDIVRYTFVIDDADYIYNIDKCLHLLEDMGYQVVQVKNSWSNPYYKGINVRLKTKDLGSIFEIQFHTPLAYRIKEGDDKNPNNSTRILYIISKDKRASLLLRARVDNLRLFLQKFILIPEGALEYNYNPEVRRIK